ncbi:MAG: hypothetical protein H0V44_06445 [Planctomycetes bacterium]|nr:hypothetical protein [Planctomycetota bacterium]
MRLKKLTSASLLSLNGFHPLGQGPVTTSIPSRRAWFSQALARATGNGHPLTRRLLR